MDKFSLLVSLFPLVLVGRIFNYSRGCLFADHFLNSHNLFMTGLTLKKKFDLDNNEIEEGMKLFLWYPQQAVIFVKWLNIFLQD